MGRVAGIGADDKGWVRSRASPLLDNVHFVTLQAPPPLYGIGRRVLFQVAKGNRIREDESLSTLDWPSMGSTTRRGAGVLWAILPLSVAPVFRTRSG